MYFDKYDLCISVASGSDVISRSGPLFAGLVKAAAADSNKFPIKICLQFSPVSSEKSLLGSPFAGHVYPVALLQL